MSSGGSSGGGGTSGKVDYPSYMKSQHEDWLDQADNLMQSAIGSSPFASAVAYDPSTEIDDMTIAVTDQINAVDDISFTQWDEHLTKVDNMDSIGEVVDFETDIYPRFERGMQNINAVQSTAFVQGKATLEAVYAAKLSGFKMQLRQGALEGSYNTRMQKIQARDAAAKNVAEVARMSIVARSDEIQQQTKYDKEHELWDLEILKYGGNLLGAIQGTATNQGYPEGQVPGGNPLGGALSGGAAGFTAGGPVGGAIGAGVGLLGGML